jgi:hypothetical protein
MACSMMNIVVRKAIVPLAMIFFFYIHHHNKNEDPDFGIPGGTTCGRTIY